MGVVHFLNVNEGDCTWIQHLSGHNTVIDVSNGNADVNLNQVFKIYEQGNRETNCQGFKEYVEQFKDSISVLAEKELIKENSKNNNINSGQQNKTINLIRLNKGDGTHDKTNHNAEGTNSNSKPVASTQSINDYNKKSKK